MFNLSITACSFHFCESHSRKDEGVYNLNESRILNINDEEIQIQNMAEIFLYFFKEYEFPRKDDDKKQTFRCEFDESNYVDTDNFLMYYCRIFSGVYGVSSDIIDGTTSKVNYKKDSTDIDTRPFYLMIVIPKDNNRIKVQKGLLIFQNVGQYGVKTVTTNYMKNYFSNFFNITFKCNTISSSMFIDKVLRRNNIRKMVMIKNIKSNDLADDMYMGYGRESRELSNLIISETMWEKLKRSFKFVSSGRFNLFEFEDEKYDDLKVIVDIGERTRTISLHNLENLSIIEGLPDELKEIDGHPNLDLLIKHLLKVSNEYLEDMVLQITEQGV